jgi:hypothetical protein
MTEPPPGNASDAQKFGSVSTKQRRIAQLAQERSERAFTSRAHLMDLDWLKEA